MVEIRNANSCKSNCAMFSFNYANKASSFKRLAEILENNGFDVAQCLSDKDITITKIALNTVQDSSVIIFSDNADILSKLIHHMSTSTIIQNIYVINLTRKEELKSECHNVREVTEVLEKPIITYLLFPHMFIGCSTTCLIHNFCKTSVFKKL